MSGDCIPLSQLRLAWLHMSESNPWLAAGILYFCSCIVWQQQHPTGKQMSEFSTEQAVYGKFGAMLQLNVCQILFGM